MSRESEVVAMFRNKEHPLSVAEIAARIGVSRPTVYLILKRQDVALTGIRGRPSNAEVAQRVGRSIHKPDLRPSAGSQARFKSYHTEDHEAVRQLAADHPAVVEGRTLFPSRRIGAMEAPRFLISGKNNPKTGGLVTKGPWQGMTIWTVTLEERATCPRSCAMWRGCYGGGMQWPRRIDAFDPDFIPALAAEVITKAREHPNGFVVRLHVLGDFFSVPYVHAWGHLLDMLPNLHVYGYTARRTDKDDAESQAIAVEIEKLTQRWDRFAIRTSHTEPGRRRAIVITKRSDDPAVVTCPAQLEKTQTCGTCGLCWSPTAQDKTIAFLMHGQPGGKRHGD